MKELAFSHLKFLPTMPLFFFSLPLHHSWPFNLYEQTAFAQGQFNLRHQNDSSAWSCFHSQAALCLFVPCCAFSLQQK